MTLKIEIERVKEELAGERRTAHGAQVRSAHAERTVRRTLATLTKLEERATPDLGSRFIPDTNEYTGRIDWAAVARGGCRRGIAKATQYREDYQFAASWRAMHAAELVSRGAYHFFTEEEPLVQADRLLGAVAAAGGLSGPFRWDDKHGPIGDFVAIDFEKAYAGAAATRESIKTLADELHNRVGARVLLYAGGPFWDSATYAWEDDLSCIWWLPAYTTNPNADLPACWRGGLSYLWQFTGGENLGPRPHTLPGLPDNIDISVTVT